MFQSLPPRPSVNLSAVFFFLLQFLLPWPASCSGQIVTSIDLKRIQLTRESLDEFTSYLTGGSTDPRSVRLPADLGAKGSSGGLLMKYIVGSAAVLGSVDACALSAIHGSQSTTRTKCLPELVEWLVEKNDRDTVARFIAGITGELHWDIEFGYLIKDLVKTDWDAMRPLFEQILTILRDSKDKSREYSTIARCMPIELQYHRIHTGTVSLDEIDKICLLDEPFHPLLREMFFWGRWSSTPNPRIREYIAEKISWFKQFMPEHIPSNAKDTSISISVEPGHDVWTLIRRSMDAETLIFVWPLVCKTWNRSYSKVLAEETRIHEWLLRDLNHIERHEIYRIAPWNHFLNRTNSAVYLGQCILSGALGRGELGDRPKMKAREYLYEVMRGEAPIPKADKGGASHSSFVKLVEEGYKVYSYWMPRLFGTLFLTVEEHEGIVRDLVCHKKLAIKLSSWWIVVNIPRIYLILGDDQVLIEQVIRVSTDNFRETLFIWIMIGQTCGMTDDTARLVFDKPGTFAEKLIRPVVVRPSDYYDHIADSGMLFEMMKIYYEHTAYEMPSMISCAAYELNHLMISFFLFFKGSSDKIDKIAAAMMSQLSTLDGRTLENMKSRFGTRTMKILTDYNTRPPEDVEFVKNALTQCGLLEEPRM